MPNSSKKQQRAAKRGKKVVGFKGPSGDTTFSYQPPLARRVRLTWIGNKVLTEAAAGTGVVNTFKLNSAFDVDDSFGSTNTPGFTEYASFFSAYRVWESSVRIEGTLAGATLPGNAMIGLWPNATNTFLITQMYSAPMGLRRVLRADNAAAVTHFQMKKRFSNPTVFRITKQQYNTDMDFTANVSANPVRIARFGVGVQGINSTTPVTAVYTIWVEMFIEFFNPYILSQ